MRGEREGEAEKLVRLRASMVQSEIVRENGSGRLSPARRSALRRKPFLTSMKTRTVH